TTNKRGASPQGAQNECCSQDEVEHVCHALLHQFEAVLSRGKCAQEQKVVIDKKRYHQHLDEFERAIPVQARGILSLAQKQRHHDRRVVTEIEKLRDRRGGDSLTEPVLA